MRLESVTYRYPGAARDAVHDVSLTIRPAEFVAILGSNGSGKSTLARIIGGWSPTDGQVLRPGDCALGRPGGTSMIFQRPESQVLGVRVRDDIVWGLPEGGRTVDVEALLAKVGLAQLADHETATLSGGQLQRLAVAAALARAPRLLVSDESTAMVDADGRQQLTELLARLPGEEGVTVVHVTHRRAEAMRAHRRITLDSGRMTPADGAAAGPTTCVSVDPRPDPRPGPPAGPCQHAEASPLVCLNGVGQIYSPRSPWAHRALTDVSFQLGIGESIVINGRNGSGKSTLAAVLAGLLSPSEGDAHMSGRPLTACPGEIGLAVQHSRLQLLAPTVGADVRAAAGVSAAAADDALAAVGLDPAVFRDRRVENLSGGQLRRAALAGLIARQPRLMILDEPLAGLDIPSRRTLIKVLADLRVRTGLTLVVISHDFDGLADVIERTIVLDGGRLVHDGPFRGDRPQRVPAAAPPAIARAGGVRTLPRPRHAVVTASAQSAAVIDTGSPRATPA
ncbi:ABC transporter ATP-binding protein, partial [Frankia sp. CIT1]|uniref:ABC transporter ATP-binding protein n=1 Tax=Frankia sp. CIT1 TaxID=2880974 RepID=UPI001EF47DA1